MRFCVGSLFCDVVPSVHSSFAIILLKKKEVVALPLLYCGCMCYASLPHGAVGWSSVCGCGIS